MSGGKEDESKICPDKDPSQSNTQTVITMILCVLSTITLITWIVIASSGVLDINTAFLRERFVLYAFLPLLIFAPFARIGKFIKIIPGVIGVSAGSMTFIFVCPNH